uniref:Uncharacterized protein n=1 Tax=Panagrolaimus davidi TaxID=227884 RepID=A0A914R1P9_9BILA
MAALAVPLGIFLIIVSGCCCAFNLSMLITLWKGSFLSPKHGGTFLLAFGHILSGFVVTFLVAFYLGPAIIAQNTLFDTLFYPELIGVIFHAQWFEDMFLQLITGVNR